MSEQESKQESEQELVAIECLDCHHRAIVPLRQGNPLTCRACGGPTAPLDVLLDEERQRAEVAERERDGALREWGAAQRLVAELRQLLDSQAAVSEQHRHEVHRLDATLRAERQRAQAAEAARAEAEARLVDAVAAYHAALAKVPQEGE